MEHALSRSRAHIDFERNDEGLSLRATISGRKSSVSSRLRSRARDNGSTLQTR